MGYKLNELATLFCEVGPKDKFKRRAEAYGSRYSVIKNTMYAIMAAIVYPRVDHFSVMEGITTSVQDMRSYDLVIMQKPDGGIAEKLLDSLVEGFRQIPEIEVFIDNRKSKVYTNGKCTVIAFSNSERNVWIKGLSAFPRLCPWIFNDKKLDKDEMEFFKLMSEYENARDYLVSVDHVCGKFLSNSGFNRLRLDRAASCLITSSKESKMKDLREHINNLRNRIESYQNDISNYIKNIKESTDKLNILATKDVDEEKNGFIDMLASSNIEITDFDTGMMRFVAYSTLSCYDEGEVDAYVLHNQSILEGKSNWCSPYEIEMPYTVEEMRSFYKAVFVDHRFDIKLAAQYTIFSGPEVTAERNNDVINEDYINNPNIGYAGCLGGYVSDLSDAEEKGDYFAAVAICQQSASSVNLGEIWPMGKVTQSLVKSTGKVIRTANGDITFSEAMNIIKEELQKND